MQSGNMLGGQPFWDNIMWRMLNLVPGQMHLLSGTMSYSQSCILLCPHCQKRSLCTMTRLLAVITWRHNQVFDLRARKLMMISCYVCHGSLECAEPPLTTVWLSQESPVWYPTVWTFSLVLCHVNPLSATMLCWPQSHTNIMWTLRRVLYHVYPLVWYHIMWTLSLVPCRGNPSVKAD